MGSNPQWKMFQPPVSHSSPMQDIKDIQLSNSQPKQSYSNGSYSNDYQSSPRNYSMSCGNRPTTFSTDNAGDSGGGFSSSTTLQGNHFESHGHLPIRETGIIEKLLHSYGFIQCCERQARLFFHFSQFSGNIEHLKIGDPVEFEMTYDRRTGKPIASTVTKIAPEVVMSEARVTGTVTTEVKGDGGSGDNTGRISYENRGECFFLPYTKDDVEGNVILKPGDAVSFQIATNQRGTLGACHVRFENPAHPVKYHGVVCSMKESFGFIERADVVKEIFFHFSETKMKEELALGDDVEFIIQTRNGKEVACNITRLPGGSVVFEDVSPEILRGQVLKPLERGTSARVQNDPLPGRIRYRALDHSEVEVPFGDKDQSGEFTLRHGDWVEFQLATDRRDQLKRATNISLLDESFNVSGERREQGVVSSLMDGFGYISCVDREQKLIFQFCEVLRLGQEMCVGDEVEFTTVPVSGFSNSGSNKPSAIRIKHLPQGTVRFETLLERGVRGHVVRDLQDANSGLIERNGTKTTYPFYMSSCETKMRPRVGDKVTFDIYQVKRNKQLVALTVQIQHHRGIMQGFIAALKDGFGFIENSDHNKEVFFHYSNYEGNADKLTIGMEVEYVVGRSSTSNGSCASAELVRLLPNGTIALPKPMEPSRNGTVSRALRSLNPGQNEYTGEIKQDNKDAYYQFGVMGLLNKADILQVGDPVSFQVDDEGMATNIVPMRKKRRATVDTINGGFGFLSVQMEDCKRLFFHMSEVRSNRNELQAGDTVEFVVLTNPRNGKLSACSVMKVTKERPPHLLARIRNLNLDQDTPRVIVLRTPKGPDGSRGFRPRRPIAEILASESS